MEVHYNKFTIFFSRVFIKGRVSAKDDKDAELICSQVTPFDEVPSQIWIQFENLDSYLSANDKLNEIIKYSDGRDTVVIYIKETRQKKTLPANMKVNAAEVESALADAFGSDNVKIV